MNRTVHFGVLALARATIARTPRPAPRTATLNQDAGPPLVEDDGAVPCANVAPTLTRLVARIYEVSRSARLALCRNGRRQLGVGVPLRAGQRPRYCALRRLRAST